MDPEAVQPAWQVVESTQPRGLATAQEMGAQVNMEKRPQERVQVASQEIPLQGDLQCLCARGQQRNLCLGSDHFLNLSPTSTFPEPENLTSFPLFPFSCCSPWLRTQEARSRSRSTHGHQFMLG